MPQLYHADIKITGFVQGILFRALISDTAQKLGLSGWVKNENDGSVTVVAEGGQDQINQLIEICKKGPPEAQVEKVETQMKPVEKAAYTDFVIKWL